MINVNQILYKADVIIKPHLLNMASSLVVVLMVITVVVLSEAGSLRNRRMKEKDRGAINKPRKEFFSWRTGNENFPDRDDQKLTKNETGSSEENRQDQDNKMQGTLQMDNNNTQATTEQPRNETGSSVSESQNQSEEINGTQSSMQDENGSASRNSDQDESSGEESSSAESGSKPNEREVTDEPGDNPNVEQPPQVFVDPILHIDDDNFGM